MTGFTIWGDKYFDCWGGVLVLEKELVLAHGFDEPVEKVVHYEWPNVICDCYGLVYFL